MVNLAALVPPPRRPLLAYHGVLAPRARWRAAIVARPKCERTTMLVAELRGKISVGAPPNDRLEDVLTSHVF